MAFNVGARLPAPYFEWVRDTRITCYHRRECVICGYRWITAEVPLYPYWQGKRADRCPHHHIPAPVKMLVKPEEAEFAERLTRGIITVVSYGGVYRRRGCDICLACGHTKARHKNKRGCGFDTEFQPWLRAEERAPRDCACNMEKFKPCVWPSTASRKMVWTTGEFSTEGLVVMDVCACPRCKSKSRLLAPKRYSTKRLERTAAHFAKMHEQGLPAEIVPLLEEELNRRDGGDE